MKCWHLVAAIAFAGCGLNTTALPSTDPGADDAGISSARASWDMSLAGSPATWPTRRRPSQIPTDGGSGDTNDAAKPPRGSTANDKDAQTDEVPGAPATPGDSAKPSGQPANGGAAKPGSQAQPQGSASDNGGNDNGGNGNGQNGASSSGSAGPAAPGSAGPAEPDKDKDKDKGKGKGKGKDDSDKGDADNDGSSDEDEEDRGSSGQRSGSGPNGQPPHSNDAVSAVVDLVLAILDLSLGPVRPAEIEALVSSILVLSLAPADLAAESLVAVLDALADTQICIDHPERCNPLCTNLESDCSACGRDQDCIERIEEMCRVTLPKTCR